MPTEAESFLPDEMTGLLRFLEIAIKTSAHRTWHHIFSAYRRELEFRAILTGYARRALARFAFELPRGLRHSRTEQATSLIAVSYARIKRPEGATILRSPCIYGFIGLQREVKTGAIAPLTLGPYPAAMFFYDILDHRKPYPMAGKITFTVQAAKSLKH